MIIKQDHSTKVSRLSSMMAWCALVCTLGLPIAPPVLALAEPARFEIASQPLSAALQAFATQAHMQLLYEHTAVAGVMSNAVSGELDKHAALEQLLRGNGLEIIFSSDNAAAIRLARANPDKDIAKEQKVKSAERDIGPAQFDSLSVRDK
jgi:hypothetical protein